MRKLLLSLAVIITSLVGTEAASAYTVRIPIAGLRPSAAIQDKDPYWNNVVLSLHMDGAQGGTTFTDVRGHVVTAVGNTHTVTTPEKFGTASGAFDGSGDALSVTASPDFDFGTNNFTIEWWWNSNSSTSRQWFFHTATDYWLGVDYQATAGLGMWASSNGTSWNLLNADPGGNGITNVKPSTGIWHHLAYVRNGSTFTLFVDGAVAKSVTGISSAIVSRASQAKVIGPWAASGSAGPYAYSVSGYMDDFRITNGVARYTGPFTPPTQAFPDQ